MKLRILLSGPGLIGRQHARIVMSRSDCVLAGIVAPERQENLTYTSSIGVPFYSDLTTALNTSNADGVIVSSPNAFHHEQAIACLQHGIPALIEKPITDDLARAAEIVEVVDKTGVPLLIGHHRTYSPLVAVAKTFLTSDSFGQFVALQGSALFLKPDHYFEDGPWRMTKGGGPILINLIHEVGLMRTFAGEIHAIHAVCSNRTRGFEVEDTVAMSLEFANGGLGTFILSDTAASSKSWEMTAGENQAYPFFPDESCYHVAGTMGSIDFPSLFVRSYSSHENRSWWKSFEMDRLAVERADPLELQIDHFVKVIQRIDQPRVSAFDGFRNLQVIDAINRSIQSGSRVVL
jgi:predicted dehydrogenase